MSQQQEIQKIDDEIFLLKQRIKNCEDDLTGKFPANEAIRAKIRYMREKIVNLEDERDGI